MVHCMQVNHASWSIMISPASARWMPHVLLLLLLQPPALEAVAPGPAVADYHAEHNEVLVAQEPPMGPGRRAVLASHSSTMTGGSACAVLIQPQGQHVLSRTSTLPIKTPNIPLGHE